MPVRVVKIGGSLLRWPPLTHAFPEWLRQQRAVPTLVVVGGGISVERLRRTRRLGPITAHWQAIEHMDANARRLATCLALPTWEVGLKELKSALRRPPATATTWLIASTRRILPQLDVEPRVARLPCSWHVTSDSIAAQLGRVLRCSDLAILKSCDIPASWDLSQLVEAGIVDGHFPLAAQGLPLRLVNLRHQARAIAAAEVPEPATTGSRRDALSSRDPRGTG
jgi:aspartokinase-like uncharacterized kinase